LLSLNDKDGIFDRGAAGSIDQARAFEHDRFIRGGAIRGLSAGKRAIDTDAQEQKHT
jgi:hypothetical protein